MGVKLSTYGLDSIFCCGLKTLASLIVLFLSCIFLLSVPPTQSTESSKLTTKKQQKSLQALLLFLIKCLETVLYASAFISSSLTSSSPTFALDFLLCVRNCEDSDFAGWGSWAMLPRCEPLLPVSQKGWLGVLVLLYALL